MGQSQNRLSQNTIARIAGDSGSRHSFFYSVGLPFPAPTSTGKAGLHRPSYVGPRARVPRLLMWSNRRPANSGRNVRCTFSSGVHFGKVLFLFWGSTTLSLSSTPVETNIEDETRAWPPKRERFWTGPLDSRLWQRQLLAAKERTPKAQEATAKW